jgi:hypothetical protein
MRITGKSVFVGTRSGIVIAFLFAAIPAAIDWYNNPGAIFRTEAGTDWAILAETWFSWFWPAALLAVPTAVPVHAWRAHRRG